MHARDGRVDAGPFAVAREEKGQTAAKAQCCACAVARPLCPGWDSWDWVSVVLGEFGWTRR